MSCLRRLLAAVLAVLALSLGVASQAGASAYQAKRPEGLATDPDLCALVACN